MPPPMPNPSKRITANPIRPARYRPGKAVPEEDSSDEDEDIEEQPRQAAPKSLRPQPQRARAPVQEDEEDDDEEGFVTDEDDQPAVTAPAKSSAPTRPATQTQKPSQPPPSVSRPVARTDSEEGGSGEGEQEEEESSEEEDSSEEESSSEDGAPQRTFQRPTFIKRADRQKSSEAPNGDHDEPSTITAATSTPDVDEQARRLAQAEFYIKDKLERDAIARSQGKKAWDDDEEVSPEDMVDDTDGLDPKAEHAAWKLRELKRLKRDREAIEAREKEIGELERRRNLTQEERDAEDREYIAKQKEERDDGRGKANFLAKYHHKGAFFQDDEVAEVLRKRDIMGARFEDDVSDKTTLPEYMRVRDMTKLGKKGRTRYTDLKGEDTGRFGEAVKRWRGSGYQNDDAHGGSGMDPLRGVDERFLPDGGRDAKGPTGANASVVGQRRERRYSRSRSRSRSPQRSPQRRRRDDSRGQTGDSYRPAQRRGNTYAQSRSRSRSRTPPPRRKRSSSPRMDRDKRRRIEVD